MVSESRRVLVEGIDPDRCDRAREWFFSWADQKLSFTDCTSFIVMRDLGLREVLTSDRHFAIAGFEVQPAQGAVW